MRKLLCPDSSNVKSVQFDAGEGDAPGTITVEFISGTYRYANCGLDDFASACHAPSVGSWVSAALVRQSDRHPATKISAASRGVPVDVPLMTLRAIASIAPTTAEGVGIANVARATVQGREPPPLPPGFPQPYALTTHVRHPGDGCAPGCRRQILWREIGAGEMHLSRLGCMSPDEAEAMAHAVLVASLQARL